MIRLRRRLVIVFASCVVMLVIMLSNVHSEEITERKLQKKKGYGLPLSLVLYFCPLKYRTFLRVVHFLFLGIRNGRNPGGRRNSGCFKNGSQQCKSGSRYSTLSLLGFYGSKFVLFIAPQPVTSSAEVMTQQLKAQLNMVPQFSVPQPNFSQYGAYPRPVQSVFTGTGFHNAQVWTSDIVFKILIQVL